MKTMQIEKVAIGHEKGKFYDFGHTAQHLITAANNSTMPADAKIYLLKYAALYCAAAVKEMKGQNNAA